MGSNGCGYKPVYCHFNFRRPKGRNEGIFAACLYADEEGKKYVTRKVRQFTLWENHQHVTAIQAYEHALRCIWEWQGKLIQHGVTDVVLVTDNSILAGWIENPKKNKDFTGWMKRAASPYRPTGAKEILLNVSLAAPRNSEKSYKFCRPELVENIGDTEYAQKSKFKIDPADLSGMGLMTDLRSMADSYDDKGVGTVRVSGVREG